MADSKPAILITGVAGFIGFHLAENLIAEGFKVFGVDNVNNYYNTKLKYDRLQQLGFDSSKDSSNWISNADRTAEFIKADLADTNSCAEVFNHKTYDAVVHLAAQPGVRMSITHPELYFQGNLVATFNLLEQIKNTPSTKLLMASSSSVYGHSSDTPYVEDQQTDKPVSLYAATKKSTEIISHYYAHQYKIDTSLLRFFTVYGPWGRPDMAVYGFFDKIINNEEIKVFNNGDLRRDFTFISDVVDNLKKLINNRLEVEHSTSETRYEIYNIGNQSPVKLLDFISLIEKITEREAKKEYLPMQPGDVYETYANSDKIKKLLNFEYNTPLEKGLSAFYNWYVQYHQIKTNSLQSHE